MSYIRLSPYQHTLHFDWQNISQKLARVVWKLGECGLSAGYRMQTINPPTFKWGVSLFTDEGPDQILQEKQKDNNPGCSDEEQFICTPFKVKQLIGFRNHGVYCRRQESSSFLHDAGMTESASPQQLLVAPPARRGRVCWLVHSWCCSLRNSLLQKLFQGCIQCGIDVAVVLE